MVVLALEGMPGAGKTSCMVSLAMTYGSSCLALSELNVMADARNASLANDWRVYHHLWLERQTLIAEVRKQFPLILVDRSHFSTIGVEQAKEAACFEGQYEEADAASRVLSGDMYDAIILCDVAPDIGLARRAGAQEIPELWSNRRFLTELRSFFKNNLPNLYQGPLHEVDCTNLTHLQTRSAMFRLLRSFGLRLTEPAELANPEESRTLLDAGCDRWLGPAYGKAFRVFGCPTLYFRQHSLQLEGTTVRWFDTSRVRELARQARPQSSAEGE